MQSLIRCSIRTCLRKFEQPQGQPRLSTNSFLLVPAPPEAAKLLPEETAKRALGSLVSLVHFSFAPVLVITGAFSPFAGHVSCETREESASSARSK